MRFPAAQDILVLLVLLLASPGRSHAMKDACYGGDVVLKPEGSRWRSELWYGVSAGFGGSLPANASAAVEIVSERVNDGCIDLERASLEGKIVLVSRGNCSFVTKAAMAQKAGAAALLIYWNETGCFRVEGDKSPEEQAITIPVISISQQAGHHFLGLQGIKPVSLSLFRPPPRDWDPPSCILLIVTAMGTLAAACCWVGHDQQKELLNSEHISPASLQLGGESPDHEPVNPDVAPAISCFSGLIIAALFIGAASAFLLFGFFLGGYSIAGIVLLAWVCLLNFYALAATLNHLLRLAGVAPKIAIPAAALCAVAVLAAWLLLDIDTWGWIPQDLMGVVYVIFVLRLGILPNLKILCIVLPAGVVYDVFWVFLQPLLTGGPSAMVEAATQTMSADGRGLPVVLQVPGWFGPPYGTTMLGFGDLVLPGLLLTFARAWDIALQKRGIATYFWPLLACYGCGLALTNLVMVLSEAAQPALLYLVPCTLLPFLLLAWRREELGFLWVGLRPKARGGDAVGARSEEPELEQLL